MFMLLLGLWQVFGNISLYTTETFFLTRTWQGKSFAGNFVIPAVIWIFLQLYEEEKRLIWWVLLGVLNLAGGASSSPGGTAELSDDGRIWLFVCGQ